MARSIPLWVFALCCLLWALFTVAFGWVVKSAVSDDNQTGTLGEVAVQVATFPDTTKQVLRELFGYATGDYKDQEIRIQRDDAVDYSGLEPVPTALPINLPGLLIRADRNRIKSGWRVVIGAFQIDGDIKNAALLLSPDLQIVKTWMLDEVPVGSEKPQSKYRKFVHGVEVLRDGSIIFSFDGGVSLQKFDACGRRQWTIPGDFNHTVNLDEKGDSVWTLSGFRSIAQVAVEDGSILRQFSVDDIIAKNPMIDILELRRAHANDLGVNSRNTMGKWLEDPFHLNDVEPLPAAIADRFKRFAPGDLLISARSLNLLFVLDPQTLKVKWWRMGASQRQHDPDWLPNGKIMIFNNRMSRDFSDIMTIDPDTFATRVLLDGRQYGFYSRIRGKDELLDDGTLVVASPQQGRAFEVDRDGNLVLEIVNVKPGSEAINYAISEMKWLPRDYFEAEGWQCQTQN